ncbi:MAG: hypothetical protein ABJB01_03265 [Rudaea sp.]
MKAMTFIVLLAASSARAQETTAFDRMKAADFRALVIKGETAYNHKDYSAAFPAVHRAACAGDVTSQEILGRMYVLGQGTSPDARTGYGWLVVASESGLPDYRKLVTEVESALKPEQVSVAKSHAEAIQKSYDRAATRMQCQRADTQGGRMPNVVQCQPDGVGGGNVLVHKCLD